MNRRGRRRIRLAMGLPLLALAAGLPGARATHGLLEHVSQGEINGNGPHFASFVGGSADGNHTFFITNEALAATDTDTAVDLYERTGGQTFHVSQGVINGNISAHSANFLVASADGSRVFFRTDEPLVSGDTDTKFDIYVRFQGQTIHASPGNGPEDVDYLAASADGTHLFFRTREGLLPSDVDVNRFDIYDATPGGLVHVNHVRQPGAFPEDALFRGISVDGLHVFFDSFEEIVSSDDETGGAGLDVYEAFGGQTFHVSIGSNALASSTFVGASADGSHVFFATGERFDPVSDTDGTQDIYERFAGGTFHVSRGALPGSGTQAAIFVDASADGSRVLFSTSEPLAATDTDTVQDLYERAGGETLHVTQGAINGNGNVLCFFASASADGTQILFTTTERLAATDSDASIDLYERAAGVTTQVSRGAVNGNSAFHVTFKGQSTDGSRVFFDTSEALVVADTDASVDLYERADDQTSQVSAGNGPHNVGFGGLSPDGGRVFFNTLERLADSDTDDGLDVYGAVVFVGPPDLVFGDGFESGDLSAWSASAIDEGDLGVSGLAALHATTMGLEGVVDDTAGLFVQDDTPTDESRYRARFYFDPNGFDPGEALGHRRTRLFIVFEEEPNRRLAAVVLRRIDGDYAVRGRCRLDDDSQADTPFVPITDEPHVVEIEWQRASGADTLDGSFQLWIDGTSVSTLTGLDNDQGAVDFVRLGALSVKAGASGTLFWDEFVSRRETYIGP